MTKRRGRGRGHGHGSRRKNKRTMRRRHSHSAHLTRNRSRRHRHRHGSRVRRGGGSKMDPFTMFAKGSKHLYMAHKRDKQNAPKSDGHGITKLDKPVPSFSSLTASAASGRQLPSRIPGVSNHSINPNGYKRNSLLVHDSNLAPIDEEQIYLLTGRSGRSSKITARAAAAAARMDE